MTTTHTTPDEAAASGLFHARDQGDIVSTQTPGKGETAQPMRPPRDDLFRSLQPGVELREEVDNGGGRTLTGHFAVFNEWTEIDSFFEGRFLERIAPGAFRKTFRERTPKVLFNHGRDPQMGDKTLGTVETLKEDERGAFYEVRLFDGIPDLLLDGLRAGEYGASFRFRVLREQIDQDPGKSEHNPAGLPERTIKEAEVMEFGPVTFPAYPEATAGVRSLTDTFTFERLARDETALRQLIEFRNGGAAAEPHPADAPEPDADEARDTDAPPTDSAGAQPHPADGRRVTRRRDPDDLSWIRGETTPERSNPWLR